MKINQDYPVRSGKHNNLDPRTDYLLFGNAGDIIDLYKEQGITIDMVMYQNEAYSYTVYPGCAWTAEGTVRFNRDYLEPALRKSHPEVKLYLGTFNTNRLDLIDHVVGELKDCVSGLGFQWEGRENLTDIRRKYPHLKLVSSESECGNGSMDCKAGEHTFMLLGDYIGRAARSITSGAPCWPTTAVCPSSPETSPTRLNRSP